MAEARVLHLFRAPKRRMAMQELDAVRVLENTGLEGCAQARPGGKRQVLLVDVETLRETELRPGWIRENITTGGLEVNGLKIGQRVTVANVELEVSAVCDPCELIEAIRPGLQAAMMGKRGMLCRVLRGGVVKAGDGICVGEDNVQEAEEAPFAENAQDKRSARRSAPPG
jgi:MOSC domain-containing protein YiiM